MYHWFKLLEHCAVTAKEPASAFPYPLRSTNTPFEILMQWPNRQCNRLFTVLAQPWTNKWASLIYIKNCKINCSRGDSESHSFFSVFAIANSRSMTGSGGLLFLQHESCHRGTVSPMNETLSERDNSRKI